MILMRTRYLFLFLIALLALAAPSARAQVGGAAEKVELLPGADSLVGVNVPGQVVRKIYNNVKFRQKGVLLYCDLAIQNVTTNLIEAYGNVRLIQGDTINVRGDTMFYYGNTRQANLRGRVVMRDRKMTLTTTVLDYDMVSGIAHYPTPGRIVDKETVLTSQEGYYDTRTKQFTFQRDVKLVNTKGTLTADLLLYNSRTRIATFQGPTRIINKDGVLTAVAGQYNTSTGISNFQQRATVNTPRYQLTGDSLYYDNVAKLGIANGNVIMVAKDKKAIITGDHVRYNGRAGVSRVTGRAVARSLASEATNDTLYLRADTLFSYDDTLNNTRRLVAQKNAMIFKSDMQSKCDSLIYDSADSTIYFYKKPIVWSQNKYQMEADTIRALMKNNRINTLFMKTKSFVVSVDTLKNFNQIKGRVITAYFKTRLMPVVTDSAQSTRRQPAPASKFAKTVVNRTDEPATAAKPPGQRVLAKTTPTTSATVLMREQTSLDRVIVEGNGQTLYYAVDEKNQMIGLNHVECSRMNIEFADNKLGQIRFYGQPDAKLIPPKEITDDDKELAGFRWREAEKPTKAQVLWQEAVVAESPAAKKSLKTSSSIKPLPKKGVQRGIK